MTEDRSATIVNRLRGIYTIPVNDGLGLLNGKDTFTREFGNDSTVNELAARMISGMLHGETFKEDDVNRLCEDLLEPDDPMGIGKKYVVPIRKEAAELIRKLFSS